MKIQFTKMHGAANDFIMIDDRAGIVPWEDHFLMAAIASRRTGIGSEGIILIQQSAKADFRMRFLNPDGSEVDMCGNGARCAAAFAHAIGAVNKHSMTMETSCGLLDAEIVKRGVKVWMPEPNARNYGLKLPLPDGTAAEGDFLNTGVPHLVIQVAETAPVNVRELGRALRLHAAFEPDGTNVNFMTIRKGNRLSMRTYERGVEDESGACGTGAVACAVIAVEKHGCTLPVHVRTPAGFELIIDGDWRSGKCTGLTLTGPVQTVYTGEIDLSAVCLENELE